MGKKPEFKEALELCDEILALLPDLPDSDTASEFSESVETKVTDMREWIEKNETVTEKQQGALENMKRGVEKWIR